MLDDIVPAEFQVPFVVVVSVKEVERQSDFLIAWSMPIEYLTMMMTVAFLVHSSGFWDLPW